MNFKIAPQSIIFMGWLFAVFSVIVVNTEQPVIHAEWLEEKDLSDKFRKRREEMEQEKVSVFKNNQEAAELFAAVPGGCFKMGNAFGNGYLEEKPIHEVCVNDFYIGKYEVTQKKWKSFMSSFLNRHNPSCFKGCENCPVEKVAWEQAQMFIKKLRKKTGLPYRLPTEAEWEYAARSGGRREKYAGTNNELELGVYAWYGGNSNLKSHPVGQKKPNGLGIFDMSGNVKEWVEDWYGGDYYHHSPLQNPKGPSSGVVRVLRGGSWGGKSSHTRTAARIRSLADQAHCGDGFRLFLSGSSQ